MKGQQEASGGLHLTAGDYDQQGGERKRGRVCGGEDEEMKHER